MGRSYVSGVLTGVLIWSVILCVFAVAYAMLSLRGGKPPAAMPAAQGYCIVGMLGVFVGKVLKDQRRRISKLEEQVLKRS